MKRSGWDEDAVSSPHVNCFLLDGDLSCTGEDPNDLVDLVPKITPTTPRRVNPELGLKPLSSELPFAFQLDWRPSWIRPVLYLN